MEFISSRTSQFEYFDEALSYPTWKGRRILDFGGNCGGFLSRTGGKVEHADYWCVDIVREALAEGRKQFPLAHFVHYDRYHSEYNPGGSRDQHVPDFGFKFDIVLAFSVFTHIHRKEMLELVGQLKYLLAPQGQLLFTFTDPSYQTGLSGLPSGFYLYKLLSTLRDRFPSLDSDGIFEHACNSDWSILVDDKLHVAPDDRMCQLDREGNPFESYCAFYSVDYMKSLFPEGRIVPPAAREWQHCCILENSECSDTRS